MPVRGVLTSWATPAARMPSDAIFSEMRSCSSSCVRSVMSSKITIVPEAAAPALIACSGTVVMFTSRSGLPVRCREVSGTRNADAPCG